MSKGKPASCESCLWWLPDPNPGTGKGLCRKNPPVAEMGSKVHFGIFPVMDRSDLCGSWEMHPAKYKSGPDFMTHDLDPDGMILVTPKKEPDDAP